MTVEQACQACGGNLRQHPALVGRDRMSGVPGRWSVYSCVNCGSGTSLPVAQEGELAAFYPGSYTPYELPSGPLATVMKLLARARNRTFPLRQLDPDRRAGTLLDVGCGRGDLAASWIQAGWSVLGIEPSEQAAEVARRRGAEVRVGTLAGVDLSDVTVDAAVFRHSLEHVVAPRDDLRRVHATLRPGGHLAVIVPNWGSWQRRAFDEYWFPLELPRHRTHFTAAGLRVALSSAGFEGIEVRSATPFITSTWSLQFRIFDRLLTRSGFALAAGYACSAPIAAVSKLLDALMGGGDFLHAHAVRSDLK